jgi:hypothetical protein
MDGKQDLRPDLMKALIAAGAAVNAPPVEMAFREMGKRSGS